MDRPVPPTAAELGITDVEYERIMRGLRQRDQAVEPARVTVASRRRPGRRRALAALGLVLAGLAVRHTAAEPAPAYAFLEAVDGRPVTYSSCRPVPVAVYPAGGPPGAENLVREAVARLRRATGLDLVVTGVFGGYATNWNFASAPVLPDDPISVSWQDGAAIGELTDEVAGLGGSRAVSTASGTRRLTSGTIALSRSYYALLADQGDHAEELAVLLHEFGHVLGLAHVDSRKELMYRGNVGQTSFGPGDLEGLRLVGQGPCT
ncbi:MAG: matrixin family metalloprotease [Propionibacteriales bacterium]|nr:matrixin family metalloprotease [Propionibacteriales bacterium]